MSTRTKLYITSYTASAMMLLNVFSKPLHIPEAFQWVLIVGAFVPLGLMFYFIKQQKLERQAQPVSTDAAARSVTDPRHSTKQRLILLMVLGSAVGLCAPFWMPLTGTTLGVRGDLACGIITAVVVCVIFGIRLRRL
jgi:hypothetical protein